MSQSFEDLIASYRSQSPAAFMTMAIMTGEPEEKDYNSPKNAEQSHGDPACDYCCCSERGYCKTPMQHAICAGTCVVLVVCCWYATKGYWGVYWPF